MRYLLALLTNTLHLLVKEFLVIHVDLAGSLELSSTLVDALNSELVLVAKLEKILLAFLETEWGRDLIVNVQLYRPEDDIAIRVDNVAEPVDKVASSIHASFFLVHELAVVATHDYEVAKIIYLKFTHDVGKFKVWNLLLGLELLLDLLRLLGLDLVLVSGRNPINDSLNEVMGEVIVDLSLVLHEDFHVAFMLVFAIDLKELSEVSLSSPADSLDLFLDDSGVLSLHLGDDVIDKEVDLSFLDVLDLVGKEVSASVVSNLLQTCGAQRE
jgi:hypothetical protein